MVQAIPSHECYYAAESLAWLERLESADFEGLLLAHRQQAVMKMQRKARAKADEAAHSAYLAARLKRRRAAEGIF